MSEKDRYESLRKNISHEESSSREGPIRASQVEGSLIQNLKLLRSLMQSEKVKLGLFESKNSTASSTYDKIKSQIIEELCSYPEENLAIFKIPKKYFDECFELLISAWRIKISRSYSQTLTFSQIQFSKESFRAFVVALTLTVSLRALRLENCSLKPQDMSLIAVMVKVHPNLTYLHLDRNPISDEGLLALIPSLRFSETLKHLSLIETNLTDEGALALSHELQYHPLKSLHLERNNLSANCIGALLKIAQGECELTYDSADFS